MGHLMNIVIKILMYMNAQKSTQLQMSIALVSTLLLVIVKKPQMLQNVMKILDHMKMAMMGH